MKGPGSEVVDAALDLAKPTARNALAAAGQGLLNLSEYLTERPDEKEPVVKAPAPDVESTKNAD